MPVAARVCSWGLGERAALTGLFSASLKLKCTEPMRSRYSVGQLGMPSTSTVLVPNGPHPAATP